MKKALTILLAAAFGLIIFSGCEEKNNMKEGTTNNDDLIEEVNKPISSLCGEWRSESTTILGDLTAIIGNGEIIIFSRFGLNDHEPIIRWIGSFVDTKEETSVYSWTSIELSINYDDYESRAKILTEQYKEKKYKFVVHRMADSQKTFLYKNGKLCFLKHDVKEHNETNNENPYIYLEKVE